MLRELYLLLSCQLRLIALICLLYLTFVLFYFVSNLTHIRIQIQKRVFRKDGYTILKPDWIINMHISGIEHLSLTHDRRQKKFELIFILKLVDVQIPMIPLQIRNTILVQGARRRPWQHKAGNSRAGIQCGTRSKASLLFRLVLI